MKNEDEDEEVVVVCVGTLHSTSRSILRYAAAVQKYNNADARHH